MLTLEEFDAGGTSKNAIERRQRIVNLSKVFDRDTFENI